MYTGSAARHSRDQFPQNWFRLRVLSRRLFLLSIKDRSCRSLVQKGFWIYWKGLIIVFLQTEFLLCYFQPKLP